jgi:hypothetical protein
VSSGRKLAGKELLDRTYEPDSDPESIAFKSTTLAKYLTLDTVLDRNHHITEAQLKRVLYKQYFDELEQSRGLFHRLFKLIFE